jgi:hypothetical protein
MSEFIYDAFISYRRSDGGRTARWLRRELQAFRPPRTLRDRLPQRLRIYPDAAYERGATDFFENTIRPALLASRFLIVVATPDAVLRPNGQDDWIAREIDEFSRGPNGHNLLLVRGAGASTGLCPVTSWHGSPTSKSSICVMSGVSGSSILCGRPGYPTRSSS